MLKNQLKNLTELGQSIWYDNIERSLLTEGELSRLVNEDYVTGVTSNPSIFEKAIAGSQAYDSQLRFILAENPAIPIKELYESLAIEDIQQATDILQPVYERTNGEDGYVSLEVSPDLASDTEGTIAEAKRLFEAVGRPNLMIKIPATSAGLLAISEVIGAGVNVNVTLIFSLKNYIDVAHAYIKGLEELDATGGDLAQVASVASFFISRVDSLFDKLLGDKTLQGKVAIANAKVAYLEFKKIFGGERFQKLATKGAKIQRPLWASTSTKNPNYSDVLYLDELIGPNTVNTVPPATIEKFKEHGRTAPTLEENPDDALALLEQLKQFGIDYEAATDKLQEDGVESFVKAFDGLLKTLEDKREAIVSK
jgi:transaldolase